jgi:hypothetical protein
MQQQAAKGDKMSDAEVDALEDKIDRYGAAAQEMPGTPYVVAPQYQAAAAAAAARDPVNVIQQRNAARGINPLPFTDPAALSGSALSLDPMGSAFRSQAATGAAATLGMGNIPTGDTAFDIANSVANSSMFSPTEQALLNQIQDPQQRAMQALQMYMQKQALIATTLSNLANMRHEMMKTVANNLRA